MAVSWTVPAVAGPFQAASCMAEDCDNLHMDRFWTGAFGAEGVAGAARKAEELNRSREPYWNIVRLLPPLA